MAPPGNVTKTQSWERYGPVNAFRKGTMVTLTLPIRKFQICTEANCKHIVCAPTLNTCKKYLSIHLKEYHRLDNINFSLNCNNCKEVHIGDPSKHSCFKNAEYYNVDISLINHPHKCWRCKHSYIYVSELIKHMSRQHRKFFTEDKRQIQCTHCNTPSVQTTTSLCILANKQTDIASEA